MKKTSILLITLMLLVSNFAKSQYYLIDTVKLNSAYTDLIDRPNEIECQKAFFDAFPNSWQMFITTYQFVPDDGYDRSMYYKALEHIEALEQKITLIDDSDYCKKIVDIAIGGIHEADAPSYYQCMLHRVMNNKTNKMLDYISKLRKGYQMQFWQFYWSNGVESKRLELEYERFFKLNLETYPNEMKIMEIAFEYFYNGVNIDGGYLED